MKITTQDVARIAHLARIAIDEKEAPALAENLSNILKFVEQMDAIDTSSVEPMAHPQDAAQRLRDDEVTEPDQREIFLRNAPATEDGLFLVPRVIE